MESDVEKVKPILEHLKKEGGETKEGGKPQTKAPLHPETRSRGARKKNPKEGERTGGDIFYRELKGTQSRENSCVQGIG